MSGPVDPQAIPLTRKQELVDYLAQGVAAPADWRIGTEHEKFVFRLDDRRRPAYDGPQGIGALLNGLTRFGWQPVREGDNVVALSDGAGASITLEPGGQFELSGAPLETLHQTCDEVHTHLDQVKQVASDLGLGFLGIGFDPKWARADVPVMPKGRYGIMRRYMPTRGDHGLDMMLRSCTVQVNLDFGSEADMVTKFRLGLALQPIATALFAASPFTEGAPNGYLSFRSFVWSDTDPDRCGMLPFVFEDGMGFERWADYVLDTPMYFVYRDGHYIDAAGQSFRDFMQAKLPALPGERPTMKDWQDHMTTVFPEVRLKHFLEMRGADGGPWGRLCALPAFWVGLLYDSIAQDAAWDLVRDWSEAEREALRNAVPRQGLATPFRGESLREVAGRVLEIAHAGLVRRARAGRNSADETEYLEPLREIVASGRTLAEELLERYRGAWGGGIDPVYDEYCY